MMFADLQKRTDTYQRCTKYNMKALKKSDVREAASTKAGGQGLRFTVRVLNKETYIYYENPAWFVEEKVY